MKLLFGEDVISSDFEGLQSLLKQYYEKRKRPLCLCTNNGVEMYIAKINESYRGCSRLAEVLLYENEDKSL